MNIPVRNIPAFQLEAFDKAKSVLHHIHLDDRYSGNGPSKVVWSDELAAFVIRAEDLYPVLEMYVNLLPTLTVMEIAKT